VPQRVHVHDADARHLPFRDESFDVVLSSLVLHNIKIDDDRRQAVREVARVLKPGGQMRIVDLFGTRLYAQELRRLGFAHVHRAAVEPRLVPTARAVFGRKQRQKTDEVAPDRRRPKPQGTLLSGHGRANSNAIEVSPHQDETVSKPSSCYARSADTRHPIVNHGQFRRMMQMSDTMRALVAGEVGEPRDVLGLESRPTPTPGGGQVLVRVRAAPIHATDLHIMRGRYGYAPAFPTVLGSESVGVVEAVGPGVDTVEVGQRVITVFVTGTWQELLVVAATQVVPVPDELSDSTACQMTTNPLTAVLLVREIGVQPGEWLLQTAAGSTVGKLVVQLATHLGIRTINVVRRRASVEEIRTLGGTEVICTEDEDLTSRVGEITGSEGVRKALDCVAGQLGADVFRALAPEGELLVYGALSTHRETDPSSLTLPLLARSVIYDTKTVRGSWLFRWVLTTPPDTTNATLAEARGLVSAGVLQIAEGQPFAMDHFAEAVQLAEAPAHGAKPLLVFDA
jgi:NADPH:quinone reductase-like Zn-dependent oxidoreductase